MKMIKLHALLLTTKWNRNAIYPLVFTMRGLNSGSSAGPVVYTVTIIVIVFFTGLLNPLDSPHHMRADTPSPYRDGVVLKKQLGAGKGSYVDVGKRKVIHILYTM